VVDIKGRSSGTTELGIEQDDQADYETASAQFNRIVVALAGRSIDSVLLGEPTTGSLRDIEEATRLSLMRFDAGLDPACQLISIQGFFGEEPESLRELRATAAIATMNRAQTRAAELVVEHRDKILAFARRLYADRRLADEALLAAIREVGPARRVGDRSHIRAAKSMGSFLPIGQADRSSDSDDPDNPGEI